MATTRRDFLKIAAMLSGATSVAGVIPEAVQRAFAIEPEPGSTFHDAEHIVILMQENRSFDHALGSLQGVRGFNDPRAIRQANGNSVFVQSDAAGNSFAPWRLDIKDTKITWMGSIPHTRESQVDAWNEGHYDRWIDAKRSHHRDYGKVPITMGHYQREDLPFYYALADAFTVCDQSFCGAMTSTTPNRCMFWSGTVRDEQNTSSKVYMRNPEIDKGGMTWKTYPERLHEAGIPWKFYQNELWTAGGFKGEEKAWLSNFGLNIMEFFAAYNPQTNPHVVLGLQEEIAALDKQIPKLKDRLSHEKDPKAAAQLRAAIAAAQERIEQFKTTLADSGEERYKKLSAAERGLFDKAFSTNAGDPDYRKLGMLDFTEDSKKQQIEVPKGDILYQFRKDVNEGKLPMVSWLGAPERFSDHPTSPWYGAWYVSEVMDILTKNPEVWKKTIFILTYDENDGYYDHVPSFVAADPKRPETGGASAGLDTGIEYTYAEDELRQNVGPNEARTGPIGMGFRIPTIVASPWSRGGWVNSQLFDHSSTLMFLEDFVAHKTGKKVVEENISAWRRAISGNLTSCFRVPDAKEPKLDYLNRDKFVIGIREAKDKEVPTNYINLSAAQIADINANHHESKFMSHQEPGVRPSCALPYELYADGSLSGDRSNFTLRLKAGNKAHGTHSAGAPFNVYLRNLQGPAGKTMRPGTYAVKAGDTLVKDIALSLFTGGQLAIDVHGPNGFYHEFRAAAHSASPQVSVTYAAKGSRLTGGIEVLLRNPTDHPLAITVRDNAYKSPAVTRTVAPQKQVTVLLPQQSSHGWYDFSVLTEGSDAESRYAGRVETGQPSISDPVMGGLV